MKKGVECYRCGRRSPKDSIVYVHNTPLGPTCVEVLRTRSSLRGSGQNAKMVETADGITILVSSVSDLYCPDNDTHCLQCPYFSDQVCPLEIGLNVGIKVDH